MRACENSHQISPKHVNNFFSFYIFWLNEETNKKKTSLMTLYAKCNEKQKKEQKYTHQREKWLVARNGKRDSFVIDLVIIVHNDTS